MRLFISIFFDDNIINELLRLQDDLKKIGVEGNYTRMESLHMTLAFVGEYDNPGDVLEVMDRVEFEPFKLALDGVGNFKKLFYVGMKAEDALYTYVKRLRRELNKLGIESDKKQFFPHITMIRNYDYKGGEMIPVNKPPIGSVVADTVVLMKSERGKHGMVYTELGSVNANSFI